MQTIIPSSVIKPCVIFSHFNLKIQPNDRKSSGVLSVAYLLIVCIHHDYHGVSFFEKLKYQSCDAQNNSVKMVNLLFDAYKNYVMPHGKHIFKTASAMAMS